eukprot:ctg_875.g511
MRRVWPPAAREGEDQSARARVRARRTEEKQSVTAKASEKVVLRSPRPDHARTTVDNIRPMTCFAHSYICGWALWTPHSRPPHRSPTRCVAEVESASTPVAKPADATAKRRRRRAVYSALHAQRTSGTQRGHFTPGAAGAARGAPAAARARGAGLHRAAGGRICRAEDRAENATELERAAWTLLQRMLDRRGRHRLNAYVYNILMAMYASRGDIDEAVAVYGAMVAGARVSPDVVTFNTLLESLVRGHNTRHRRPASALWLACLPDAIVERMEQHGVRPNVRTLSAHLRLSRGRTEAVRAVEARAASHRIALDAPYYDQLIDAYACAGDVTAAAAVLKRLHASPSDTAAASVTAYAVNGVLKACAQSGAADHALQLVQNMAAEYRIEPDAISYTCALTALGRARRAERAGGHRRHPRRARRHRVGFARGARSATRHRSPTTTTTTTTTTDLIASPSRLSSTGARAAARVRSRSRSQPRTGRGDRPAQPRTRSHRPTMLCSVYERRARIRIAYDV